MKALPPLDHLQLPYSPTLGRFLELGIPLLDGRSVQGASVLGLFWHAPRAAPLARHHGRHLPETCIVIYARLPPELLIGVVLHEIGHSMCHVGGCECMMNSDVMMIEAHADLFALNAFVQEGHFRALGEYVRSIIAQSWGANPFLREKAAFIMGQR